MCDYLESTANCLYGNGCQSEEKVHYTRSQRKCKNTLMGITTFITIANVVVDWYNFIFYQSTTQKDIIYTRDIITNTLFWTFLALCCISSIFLMCELVSFVIQLKDARIYESPVKRSELFEEIISGSILFFENFGIPLVFLIGFFTGICPMVAQIRSFTGRIALVVAGISVVWRLIQSFSFCPRCEQEKFGMTLCQTFRAMRGFITIASASIIVFLLAISLSLEVGIKVDRYNGRYHGQQFSDIQKEIYLYQRVTIPYYVNHSSLQSNEKLQNCSFFETKIEIAKSKDIETVHSMPYIKKIPCEKFSPFYTSFITTQHLPLLATYDCSIIVGITNSDFTSARIVNAAYELSNSKSKQCVSNSIELVLDTKYDPSDNFVKETSDIWNSSAQDLLKSLCSNMQSQTNCADYVDKLDVHNSYPIFSCKECIQEYTPTEVQTLALVSKLIVSEKEMLSYYPCMPKVHVYDSIELPLCERQSKYAGIASNIGNDLVTYTTCIDPYVTNSDNQLKWQQEEKVVLTKTKMN